MVYHMCVSGLVQELFAPTQARLPPLERKDQVGNMIKRIKAQGLTAFLKPFMGFGSK